MPFIELYTPSFDSTSEMFRTHWNYIKCLNSILTNLQITINVSADNQLDSQITNKFQRLSQITKLSIQSDLSACRQEVAYASVVAPWIPVKCYYRLYYLETIFLYYLSGDQCGFRNGGHTRVRASFLNNIEQGNFNLLNSSSPILSEISVWETASSFRTFSRINISGVYYMYPDCHKSIRKKMAEYIKIDWMQKNNLQNFRTALARQKRDTQLKPKKFLLTDYFYWMRIKANYRDVDFLDFDHDVHATDSFQYIKEFIETSEKYASALENAIIGIKLARRIT